MPILDPLGKAIGKLTAIEEVTYKEIGVLNTLMAHCQAHNVGEVGYSSELVRVR